MEINLRDKNSWIFLIIFFSAFLALGFGEYYTSIKRFIYLEILPTSKVNAAVLETERIETFAGLSTAFSLQYSFDKQTYTFKETVNNVYVEPKNNTMTILVSQHNPKVAAISSNGIVNNFVSASAMIVVSLLIFWKGINVLKRKKASPEFTLD